MKKLLLLLLMSMFIISSVSANSTYEKDEEINVTVVCLNEGYCSAAAYCNINIINPNGGFMVIGQNMTNQNSYHNYTINGTYLGTYSVGGFCIDGDDSQEIDFCFDVTENGNPTPTGMPTFNGILLLVIFGVSIFFMIMSFHMDEVAFKIFFLVLSFIFIMATMLTGYMVLTDANASSGITATTLSLVYVLGAIVFIVFFWVLLRQTINAIELMKVKRGLSWDGGSKSRLSGYTDRKAY